MSTGTLLLGLGILALPIWIGADRALRGARSAGRARMGLVLGWIGAVFAVVGLASLAGIVVSRIVGAVSARPEAAALAGAVITASVLALSARPMLRWFWGTYGLYSGQLQLGDHIQIHSRAGRLSKLGLLSATLSEGVHAHLLSWSELGRGPLTVTRPDAPVPVRLELELPGVPTADQLRRMELSVRLCPYRTWSDTVEVRLDPGGSRRLHIRLWTWSESARSSAEGWIRRALTPDQDGS